MNQTYIERIEQLKETISSHMTTINLNKKDATPDETIHNMERLHEVMFAFIGSMTEVIRDEVNIIKHGDESEVWINACDRFIRKKLNE